MIECSQCREWISVKNNRKNTVWGENHMKDIKKDTNKLEKDPEKEVSILGERLEELKDALGYSHAQIANMIGKSKATVVGYKTGDKYPKFKEADKLAAVLGTSTSYLTGETDNPAPSLTQKEAISLAHAIENAPKDIWHYDGVPLTDEDIKRILDKLNSAMKYNKSDNRA